MPPAVLIALAILLLTALVAVVVLRRSGGERASGLIQQQLIELRTRFDQLVAAQQEVPRTLATGSSEQARVLHDVRERLGALGEVTKRLETMAEAVTEVQQLLQVPRLRGTIGEVWLEELLRQILPPAHYEMQYQFRSGERVDAALRLAGRLVPVDAKFPLEACQRMLASHGADEERERRAFTKSLRDRIDEIADKYIRPDEGTYDFALMYIPAENVYYEAVLGAEDPGDQKSVLGHALQRRVIPVSPHTFYAYLLVILHGLKGMQVEEQAREIQGQLGGLRQQFEGFWTAFQTVGTHLTNASKKFEESERQADRVRDRLERIAGPGSTAGAEQRPGALAPPDA
jgi:DNA recombination protein RmuC